MGYDSPFDNLARKETYRDRSPYGNKSAYSENRNVYQSQSPYSKDDSPYRQQEQLKQEKKEKKYLRFNDLKLLNEFMMHLANNTLADNSRIDILGQGMLGEIKNLLADRIFKIAIIPALMSIILALTFAVSKYFVIDTFALLIYLGVLVRVFYYPAKLYYANIRYTTCLPAQTFFDETKYWFRMSVFHTFASMIIVAVLLFVLSFFQHSIIQFLLFHFGHISATLGTQKINKFIASISFSISWKIFPLFIIFLLFFYVKFINKEKKINEAIKEKILKEIRDETISPVKAVQENRY